MNRYLNTLRYILPTARMDLLWLPAGLTGLCAAILLIVLDEKLTAYNLARSFLGGVLPLIGGILAAYSVLDDPTLELQFATPRSGRAMLLERLGAVFAVLTACALTFQAFAALVGVDLAPLSAGVALRQLVWLAPALAMMALGAAAGFTLAQSTAGALAVSGIWIFQVIVRNWMAADPVGRYFYLFMGASSPDLPWLRANQISLLVLTGLLFWASARMLKKQERFI